MRLLAPLAFLHATSITATPPSTPAPPLSLQMAHSIISRAQGIYTPTGDASGPLQAGLVQQTLTALASQYPTAPLAPALAAHVRASAASLLPLLANTTSALKFSLDRLSAGPALARLAGAGERGYAEALAVLDASVRENPRNAEGGLWYYVYPGWSYLDGMFSFGPFGALRGGPGGVVAWREVRRQFVLLGEHCAVGEEEGEAGLLVHGYDASRTAVWANNTRGQSPHVWGRSMGWYVLGLLETIAVLDTHAHAHANDTEARSVRDEFAAEFRARMHAVVRATDPATGAWWQLLDTPGRAGNYIESSASAMFAWALLKGVRLGYLTPTPHANTSYVAVGRRAYGYLRDTFVVDYGNGTLGWNGTVSVCSLNSSASYEYYTTRPILYNSVLGSAAFVGASMEVERLEGWY